MIVFYKIATIVEKVSYWQLIAQDAKTVILQNIAYFEMLITANERENLLKVRIRFCDISLLYGI